MVLFSAYRSQRLVGPTFMKGITDRTRAFSEWYMGRPWASGYVIYSMDARTPLAITCIWYFMQRYFHASLEEDEFERTLIERWGGSVDAVRQNLTKEDQARARAALQHEQYYGSFLPAELRWLPPGLDLPGPAPSHHH